MGSVTASETLVSGRVLRSLKGLATGFILPLVISAGIFTLWLHHTHPPMTGDEPCYAIQARSIANDGDLDLTNDFHDANGVLRYSPVFARGDIGGCATRYPPSGKLRAIFNPGLPFLLAIVMKVTFGIDNLRLAMIAGAAFFAAQLFGLFNDLKIGIRWLRWFVWAACIFTLPILGFSNQFYPEIPAALAVTLWARLLIRSQSVTTRRSALGFALGMGLCSAVLPWLHNRFGLIAVVLLALGCVAELRRRPLRLGEGAVSLLPLVLPFVLSVVLLAVFYQHVYGSFLPSAPYHGPGIHLVKLGPPATYRTGIGSLLSITAGLLPFSPFFFLGLVGLPLIVRRFGVVGLVLTSIHR